MSEGSLLAGQQLEAVLLTYSHFEVADSAPKGDAQITLTVETSDTTYEVREDNTVGTTRVTVVAKLVSETDQGKPNMQLRVIVTAVVSSPGDIDEGETRKALRYQSIAEGYAFVRNHVMQIAAASPMSRFVLPTVDVSVLMG